jgi:putative restriction endonuclease
MPERIFGEIDGFPVGSTFTNRRDLAASGVHRPIQAGICGGKDGAESIVVSGGYVDDEDLGEEIIYTGQGGRDENTGEQIADQKLTLGNAGLARSNIEGFLVRVVRGAGGNRDYSPSSGLRYDGLFRVADYWHETGRNGFRVWRYRLMAHTDEDAPVAEAEEGTGGGPVPRVATTVQRQVRSTRVAQHVKEIHRHTCQICEIRIDTPAGPYAEAAHIRALGKPHDGPDEASNVLCLCPNHHVMFDTGAIYIGPDWTVRDSSSHGAIVRLRRLPAHNIDPAQLAYHKAHHVP